MAIIQDLQNGSIAFVTAFNAVRNLIQFFACANEAQYLTGKTEDLFKRMEKAPLLHETFGSSVGRGNQIEREINFLDDDTVVNIRPNLVPDASAVVESRRGRESDDPSSGEGCTETCPPRIPENENCLEQTDADAPGGRAGRSARGAGGSSGGRGTTGGRSPVRGGRGDGRGGRGGRGGSAAGGDGGRGGRGGQNVPVHDAPDSPDSNEEEEDFDALIQEELDNLVDVPGASDSGEEGDDFDALIDAELDHLLNGASNDGSQTDDDFDYEAFVQEELDQMEADENPNPQQMPPLRLPPLVMANVRIRQELLNFAHRRPLLQLPPGSPPGSLIPIHQFAQTLKETLADFIPMRTALEKVRLDTMNYMWRSTFTHMNQRGRNVEKAKTNSAILDARDKLLAGMAGRKSHTWQCVYMHYNNCTDANVCWDQKFADKVQWARQGDCSHLVYEFQANAIFITSCFSSLFPHGSKSFPPILLFHLSAFIMENWPNIHCPSMSLNERTAFRTKIRDEVTFKHGLTGMEVEDYLNFFTTKVRENPDQRWEEVVSNVEFRGHKRGSGCLSDEQKALIANYTLAHPMSPQFSLVERATLSAANDMPWEHFEAYQRNLLHSIKYGEANEIQLKFQAFFEEKEIQRTKRAKRLELADIPGQILDELFLPREHITDIDQMTTRAELLERRRLARGG